LAMFMQLLSQLSLINLPTPTPVPATPTAVIAPTQTATAVPPTAVPTSTSVATAVPTSTPVPSATRTATRTATQTATATRGVVIDNSDPTGFAVLGRPPAQKLPSAILIYPLITSRPTEQTLVEMVNLTGSQVVVHCHYIRTDTCNGIDFSVRLTAHQPIAWNAGTGRDGNGNRVAPPFTGEAELKCFVQPSSTALSAHNAVQGRALVQDNTGQTIGYAAIGFRRLIPGSFSGDVELDGVTYEQCPDRLHFQALASTTGSDSEIILVPCEEDLLRLVPAQSAIQFAVINEFEQQFSGSIGLRCYSRTRFSNIPALRRSSVGTDTVHAIVRAVDVPVVGLVIDRFTVPGSNLPAAAANNPFLEGGRSATITIPHDNF
ncbi:MAG TPA: hypothetical protein VEB21_10655, partial [Terriglobales bacterium]|nr:hypothetical protein [Terriglobales bacterium]